MKQLFASLLSAALLITTALLALTEPAFSQGTGASPINSAVDSAIDFETPPVFRASEFLTPEQLKASRELKEELSVGLPVYVE